jgi:hypothetical protein
LGALIQNSCVAGDVLAPHTICWPVEASCSSLSQSLQGSSSAGALDSGVVVALDVGCVVAVEVAGVPELLGADEKLAVSLTT